MTYSQLRPKLISRALGFDSRSQEGFLALLGRLKVPDRPTKSFSKGELVKLGLAVAFARSVSLVMLDEPTSGLDPMAVEDVEYVCRDHLERGGSLLVATHRLEDLRAMTGRTILLHEGSVLYDGRTTEFLRLAVRVVLETVPAWLVEGYLSSVPHSVVRHTDGSEAEVITPNPDELVNVLRDSQRALGFVVEPSLAAGVRRVRLMTTKEGG